MQLIDSANDEGDLNVLMQMCLQCMLIVHYLS